MKNGMRRMIADIEREVEYTSHLIGKRALDPRVMKAMEEVPRDAFVPPNMTHLAFDNGPLPIGFGQTVSQPYIVALMSDLLQTRDDHVVLEIGTGSGYQTAILSRLVRQVYSIEVVRELGESSARRLQDLGYLNIGYRIGNGYAGWPEHAPYNGIIVTAAATRIPMQLVDQLVTGGRLVIPVGEPYAAQELVVVTRGEGDHIDVRNVLGVAFVPMREDADAADREVRVPDM